jgi:hypothetical protein
VWGGQLDWFYGARGIPAFTCELWSSRNLMKTNTPPTREEEMEFMRHVLMNEGLVRWREFQHPTYGKIEIGGRTKTWGRTPVSFLLEEECHRNMAFTLYHASQLPRVALTQVEVEPLSRDLHRVWVTMANSRLLPTRTQQDVKHHLHSPDILTLEGEGITVLSSGRVVDRFFKKVEAVRRRPERLELESVLGGGEPRAQFVVSGQGKFTLRFHSVKGGVVTGEYTLPE